MFREARKGAGLTLEKASLLIPCGRRNLCKYEAGEVVPDADVVLRMSKVYERPEMTKVYCRNFCSIGRELAYEYLDAVSLDPFSVLIKLRQELEEAQTVYDKMLFAVINKRNREDFTAEEWRTFMACVSELFDVEHNLETLRISLSYWCSESVIAMVNQHNEKCINRGYVRQKLKPAKKPPQLRRR